MQTHPAAAQALAVHALAADTVLHAQPGALRPPGSLLGPRPAVGRARAGKDPDPPASPPG